MKSAIAFACAALTASPALAGDQPVILPVKPPYWEVIDVPVYTMTGVTPKTVRDLSATQTAATPVAAARGAGGSAVVGLTPAQSDALYARLLAEAKKRKLR